MSVNGENVSSLELFSLNDLMSHILVLGFCRNATYPRFVPLVNSYESTSIGACGLGLFSQGAVFSCTG